MGELKVMYLGNGGTTYTNVSYAAAGVNDDGEVINEERFKDFWHRVNIALKKKYEGEKENVENHG
jgi:hypothetical protein